MDHDFARIFSVSLLIFAPLLFYGLTFHRSLGGFEGLLVLGGTKKLIQDLVLVISLLWMSFFGILFPSFSKTSSILTTLKNSLFGFIIGVFAFHIIAILFGAPFIQNFEETVLWSALMSSLFGVPLFSSIGFNFVQWRHFLSLTKPRNGGEAIAWIPSWCCILGAWIGAFPIPLDWDRPWQEWPISCIYGVLFGYLVGLVLSNIFIHFRFFDQKYKL